MRYLILVILIILSGCASKPSKYAGNSIEARDARDEASYIVLNKFAPDGCSYDQYTEAYQCDNPQVAVKINKRVADVRGAIVDHLYDDPYLRNFRALAGVLYHDLYQCGDISPKSVDAFHCEVKFPRPIAETLVKKGAVYAGVVDGKHKYIAKK